jgi:hypothetical protein
MRAPQDLRPALGTLGVVPATVLLFGDEWRVAGASISQLWLLPLIGGAFLGLGWVARSGRAALARGGSALRAFWLRADPLLAAGLLYAVLFRTTESVLAPVAIFAAMALGLALLRRLPGPLLVSLAVAALVFGVALPRAFRALVISRVAASYSLDVDHRPWPDGKEINEHGARFRGAAADLADDDFVILFLGDSFTFGWNLPYEQSYPYRFEAIAAEAGCDARVRVVNFGWTSSSPLLSLRLLRQVGYAYRPDLVVYSLDMTDFHDDLRYERALREQGDLDVGVAALGERLVATELPRLSGVLELLRPVTTRLRASRDERAELLEGLAIPARHERYFITARPLDETRPAIELGVMRNLAEMHAFTQDVLGGDLALVVYPRAYQYSRRESPRNWERGYEVLGPHVREPFRYFSEIAPQLPYPVIDLLPDFEGSDTFPLFFANDPHWSPQGAELAAHVVFERLVGVGMVPCGARR